MKTFLIFAALSVFTLLAGWEDYKLEDKSTFSHTFTKDHKLDVDNVNGFVEITSDNGSTIRMEGERIIRAKDQQNMDLAKKEVTVDFNEKDGTAQAYVNGPFRSNGRNEENNHGFHDHPKREYQVMYNFTIRVPKSMDLQLRSVNGHITVKDVRGTFDVNAVNGKLDMVGMRGAGHARAVNGATHVEFAENPTADSSINTVNGKVELTLPSRVNALLKFKTVNGHVYTDFEGLPVNSTTKLQEQDGRRVYNSRRTPQEFKLGSGNPVIDIQTVNGAIEIKKGK